LRYNLLVIEASTPSLDEIIVSNLSENGFKLATCSDHLEVLARLGELKPDLIILGEGLPVNSFEICCQLRQAVDVPILMMGRVPRAIGWVEAVKSGADCYVEKPVGCLELMARAKAILRRCEWTLGKG
jgi:DNA-binding response OmpR family regulator